jgi:hypothetical protein
MQQLRGRVATAWDKPSKPQTCRWVGVNNRACKNPFRPGKLFCKGHCCFMSECRAGASSKQKYCPTHSSSKVEKPEGKRGRCDIARCIECHSKIAVCVCNERQARARVRTQSASSTQRTKKLVTSAASGDQNL